jgi:hypothetical protein
MKSGNLNILEPSGPLLACNGTAAAFYKSYFAMVDISMKTMSMALWEFRPILVGNLNIPARIYRDVIQHQGGFSYYYMSDNLYLHHI